MFTLCVPELLKKARTRRRRRCRRRRRRCGVVGRHFGAHSIPSFHATPPSCHARARHARNQPTDGVGGLLALHET